MGHWSSNVPHDLIPMENTEKALIWIVTILRKHNIPFQITGGFAARIYGSTRTLADIDIDIAGDRITELAGLVREYITYGPEQYKDEKYDLMIMTLNYMGQNIDIDPEVIKIYNAEKKEWVTSTANIQNAIEREVYGIKVPVIPVDELIKYKLELRRDVDLQDVKDLQGLGY